MTRVTSQVPARQEAQVDQSKIGSIYRNSNGNVSVNDVSCEKDECLWHNFVSTEIKGKIKSALNQFQGNLGRLDRGQKTIEQNKGTPFTIIGADEPYVVTTTPTTDRRKGIAKRQEESGYLDNLAKTAFDSGEEVINLLSQVQEPGKKEAAAEVESIIDGEWRKAGYRLAHNISLNASYYAGKIGRSSS